LSGIFDDAREFVGQAVTPKAPAPTKPAAGSPSFTIPPAPAKNATSSERAFQDFVNAHPIMRGYAPAIRKWAKVYGVDRVVMATLFWRESFASATGDGRDPATITSPADAVGIGQIHRPTWLGEKAPWGETITNDFMQDPDRNIRWSTWYFAEQLKQHGTPDAAYNKGYNPGYTGPPLTGLLPKGYVPQGGLTPDEKASVSAVQSVATKKAKQLLTDPWVVLDKGGHIDYVQSQAPPKNALKYGGQPLTQSGFQQVWTQGYADTFDAYTGRAATGAEMKKILSEGITPYTLATRLAGTKDFLRSPTYKKSAPGVALYVKEKLGRKPNAKKVGQIIAENWDPATLDAWIQEQPGYMQGPEYQQRTASLRPVYEQIMGKPDERGEAFIHEAAVNEWTEDALANALRSDEAYKFSPEYQAKTVNFLDAMGLFIGARPVLKMDPQAKKKPTPQLPMKLTGGGLSNALPYQATYKTPKATR
jgi:hypothetical protein